MKLGVKDAEFHSIDKISEGQYYVKGANLTQSAFLEVNGELIQANFIDENTLLVLTDQLKDGDTVDIAIRSNSSTHRVLTRTEKYIYHEPLSGTGEGTLEPAAVQEENLEEGQTQEEEVQENAAQNEDIQETDTQEQ